MLLDRDSEHHRCCSRHLTRNLTGISELLPISPHVPTFRPPSLDSRVDPSHSKEDDAAASLAHLSLQVSWAEFVRSKFSMRCTDNFFLSFPVLRRPPVDELR